MSQRAEDPTVHQLFAEAAYAYAELVRAIRPGAWDGPGLGEWDLRALVGHTSRSLITVETYLAQPAASEVVTSAAAYYAAIGNVDPASVVQRGRDAGAALGEDPLATVEALVARVLPLIDRPDDPLLTTIAGGMRLSTYLPTRYFELVVHGYDIAASAGLEPPAYSVPLLSAVLALASGAAVLRGQGPELLRAVTGRTRLPDGFSVV